ncbi:nucleotidyltransferase domain-containing protein [Mariniphaga sediminis]|jgi:predicted nucleotidyltransferase|uniref:Nucleotidyltransferase domain-containing protein n=1 Tax=Mariniphaga sediminis TaxID=1628158 RepID=A0A399D5H6_9BACT|nr:nucleotidyltransferase domain-containing protein [Mariniphaga sediminis]RIH66746.1 nucleotidyltransferase domain-containing protein [Mariniphaga sediminis]
MTFGLNDHTIQKIKNVFASHSHIEKAILYGSRAKGNFKPGSDIDLALIAPGLSLPDLFKIENQLDDLLLPWKIDLSLTHQITNQELLNHIARIGIIFYEKKNHSAI